MTEQGWQDESTLNHFDPFRQPYRRSHAQPLEENRRHPCCSASYAARWLGSQMRVTNAVDSYRIGCADATVQNLDLDVLSSQFLESYSCHLVRILVPPRSAIWPRPDSSGWSIGNPGCCTRCISTDRGSVDTVQDQYSPHGLLILFFHTPQPRSCI